MNIVKYTKAWSREVGFFRHDIRGSKSVATTCVHMGADD